MPNIINSKYIFENVNDLDLTAQYPNIIIAYNISNDLQHGKIMFKEPHKDVPDTLVDVPAWKFIDSLITRNYIHTGSRYFNLSKIDKFITKIKKSPEKYLK